MYRSGGDSVSVGVDLDRVLLATKLRVPLPPSNAVSRAEVIERARASRAPVITVTAPAGYGKSTMLAEWAAREPRPVAWLSLAGTDDDPAALLRLLAAATAGVSQPAAAVAAEMPGVGGFTLGRSAPLLAAALANTPEPFVLFVDDVHVVDSPGCRDVLDVLLDGIPPGSHVVLAGRHEQPYLARLRAAGRVLELGEAELRVDLAGAQTIFDAVGVGDADASTSWTRCEGWAAGVYLCALIARDGGATPAVSGDDRYIADYLYRECVEHLPAELQRFLRRTAVLEQLSAPLCDAVLGTTDAAARLRELEALNLFLVPLDRTRGWYRYHALFREFLLAELERIDDVDAGELHQRAAAWYESGALLPAAIEHLLLAGERERSVQLVAAAALPMYLSGEVGVVSRWLDELGAPAVSSCPELLVIAAWLALLTGATADAERWAHVIEQVRLPEGAEGTIEFESARAQLRVSLCAEGAAKALVDAKFGYDNEPPWSPWRDQAVYMYGSALVMNGDVETARAIFAEGTAAANSGERNTDCVILTESELAVLATDDGDWVTAARHADTALALIAANHLESYATSALAFAVGARVAIHEGDRPGAERLLARGMRTRVLTTYVIPAYAMRVRLQLAKAHVAIDDRLAAAALMREASDLLRKRPDVGALATAIRAFRDTLESAPRDSGAVPLSPAELRLLPYLQTHLTLGEIAQRLFVSRNTVSSQVTSVYRKLGVNARGPAVRRATEIGLLGH